MQIIILKRSVRNWDYRTLISNISICKGKEKTKSANKQNAQTKCTNKEIKIKTLALHEINKLETMKIMLRHG